MCEHLLFKLEEPSSFLGIDIVLHDDLGLVGCLYGKIGSHPTLEASPVRDI